MKNPRADSAALATRRRIGQNVRLLREGSGRTQQALAEAAGLAVRHLQKIEHGTVNVTIGTLALIAQALSRDVVALFNPVPDASASPETPT